MKKKSSISAERSSLPIQIDAVKPANLIQALDAVRGCLKATSMLWMRSLGLPTLSGVIVSNWSSASAAAVRSFSLKHAYSSLLLRIDKRDERWTKRRGGYILPISQVPGTVRELKKEGMIAVLLEPASPYKDLYSLAAVFDPARKILLIEVVGPGFDASDILRSDMSPHERWEIAIRPIASGNQGTEIERKSLYRISSEDYKKSVATRLTKIGARLRNPAFPTLYPEPSKSEFTSLRQEATDFLRKSRQTALLDNSDIYHPIPSACIDSFTDNVMKLLSGLSGYGIHLGPSSFAASVLPKRGLVFWDFFPARKNEAVALYPR